MLNPPVNGKIQGLFKAFECFSSTFQGKFNFQDSLVYSSTFQACVNLEIALIKTTTLLYALFMNESNICSETFYPILYGF